LIIIASAVGDVLWVATNVAHPRCGGYFLLLATGFFTVP